MNLSNDGLNYTQILTPSCQVRGIPAGHVLCNEKWRYSDLSKALQREVSTLYSDNMGIVDFNPSSQVAVLFLLEADLISGTSYRRKLAKLKRAPGMKGIVIAENTPTTASYFVELQKFCCLVLGLPLLPVQNQEEAAQLIAQMVLVENRGTPNPFASQSRNPPLEHILMNCLLKIPSLGEVKARALLNHFKSLKNLALAEENTIAQIVGHSTASKVYEFLHQTVTPINKV